MNTVKLLIVGASGQVARSLTEAARQRHINFSSLGRPDLDITNHDAIEQAIDGATPDYVINAAAYTTVDKAEDEDGMAYAVNHFGAGNLAAACRNKRIPLIHLSTDYVFDGHKTTAYDETDPTTPLSVYGHSKLAGEKAVKAATAHHIILRTSWVYSPFGQNFVRTMLKLAQSRDGINVVDDQHGCPSYAPHLAQGILELVEKLNRSDLDERVWGLYHMAGAGETTWCDFAREIFAQSQKMAGPSAQVSPIPTSQYPTPAPRPANSRLDCTKLHKVFGIRLPKWQDGMASCIERLQHEVN